MKLAVNLNKKEDDLKRYKHFTKRFQNETNRS